MNKWISVRERVPAEWIHVLVVVGLPIHHIVEVAVYVGSGKWRVTWNHDQLEEVTYWMPLPELPELPVPDEDRLFMNWLMEH